jgi:uncharacterized membrane protein
MEQKVTSHVVKGLILSLILIVYGLILYFTGLQFNKGLSSVQYLIIFGGIIWGCIDYAKQKNGDVTFGNVFAYGFKISVVITVILVVYSLIAMNYIFPEMKEKIMDMSRQEMEVAGKLSDAQIDQSMEMMKKYFTPFMIGGMIFMFLLCGVIAGLIGAAVAKKNPANPFNQQQS